MRVRPERIRRLDHHAAGTPLTIKKAGTGRKGPVIYWMNRDQRVRDNWALIHAQDLSLEHGVPLIVVHNLIPAYLGGGARQLDFKLKNLVQVQRDLALLGIGFILINDGDGVDRIIKLSRELGAIHLVTDFNPLRSTMVWIKKILSKTSVPFSVVDAHNIVPCWVASPKQDFAARTIRPKITRQLKTFLEDFPKLKKQKNTYRAESIDVKQIMSGTRKRGPEPVDWVMPGEKHALQKLGEFIDERLPNYDKGRNDPSRDFQSGLSPYLHYGQISAQRVALEVMRAKASPRNKNAFLEELIVRRELSDNFCFYNLDYDSFQGFPGWAQNTLNEHRRDRRDHVYTREQLEEARTHDRAWNAAQKEMLRTGKMHGYMRMYWAKKILEWSRTPEEALATAIYLNDKYELDGRDPNGYVGVSWSIGGVHDRAWSTRPVFGKIRYMSYGGLKSKFDIARYIEMNEA